MWIMPKTYGGRGGRAELAASVQLPGKGCHLGHPPRSEAISVMPKSTPGYPARPRLPLRIGIADTI